VCPRILPLGGNIFQGTTVWAFIYGAPDEIFESAASLWCRVMQSLYARIWRESQTDLSTKRILSGAATMSWANGVAPNYYRLHLSPLKCISPGRK
jgi:hypothetical protein